MIAVLAGLILLTSPDGTAVWVNQNHIQMVTKSLHRPHGCHHGAQSIIKLESGGILCVRETPEEIERRTHQ
jgi:uncharacterized protein YlzI (FlbEa/FlbD family)